MSCTTPNIPNISNSVLPLSDRRSREESRSTSASNRISVIFSQLGSPTGISSPNASASPAIDQNNPARMLTSPSLIDGPISSPIMSRDGRLTFQTQMPSLSNQILLGTPTFPTPTEQTSPRLSAPNPSPVQITAVPTAGSALRRLAVIAAQLQSSPVSASPAPILPQYRELLDGQGRPIIGHDGRPTYIKLVQEEDDDEMEETT